jgi:hypothetical protein
MQKTRQRLDAGGSRMPELCICSLIAFQGLRKTVA